MTFAAGWFGLTATAVVLLIAAGLVTGMIAVVRAVSDDSGKQSELKDFVEALFATPKHLRPDPEDNGRQERQAKDQANGSAATEPFSEPCPGCGETVTEDDWDCPVCGLRLL
jgi:hypothetical protein